ncbi:hypothetical protein LXL04_037096 [Taraxacum kok-saghyz]
MRGSQLYTALFFPSLKFFPTEFSLASLVNLVKGDKIGIDFIHRSYASPSSNPGGNQARLSRWSSKRLTHSYAGFYPPPPPPTHRPHRLRLRRNGRSIERKWSMDLERIAGEHPTRHFIEHMECKINKNSHIKLILREQALQHLYIEN